MRVIHAAPLGKRAYHARSLETGEEAVIITEPLISQNKHVQCRFKGITGRCPEDALEDGLCLDHRQALHD